MIEYYFKWLKLKNWTLNWKVKEKLKPWKFEQLRLYINYVKKFEPMLTPEANLVIQRYYQLQRQADDRNAARTTVRMLESVIRLSQGKT